MDNKQLITRLARQAGMDYKEVSDLVQAVASAICDSMAECDSVAIPAFGTFTGVKHEETVSTDLSTGKRVLLPPAITAEFTPSNVLKRSVQ